MKTFKIIIISIVGILFMFYICLDNPFEKLFTLGMGIFILIPIFLSMLGFLLKTVFIPKSNKHIKIPMIEISHNTNDNKYKSKIVTVDGYSELQHLITASSKSKKLSRKTILELKAELRNILGVHYECYKNMTFKNDMHEIYILIKSSKLTTKDYNYLYTWIKDKI